MTENEISRVVVDSCFKLHKELGPGLLESVYEQTLCYELTKRNLKFLRQRVIPVIYDDTKLDAGFRADLIVENKVIVEIKSVDALAPVHGKNTPDLPASHGH